MIRAFKAEWLKLMTTKLWWIMGICIVVLMAGFSALFGLIFHFADESGKVFNDMNMVHMMWTVGHQTARVLALIVGVLVMGNEYRHKTFGTTYLATPNRYLVLAAKAITMVLIGAIYGIVGSLAGVLGAAPFVIANDGDLFLGKAASWKVILMSALVMGLWTLMGMGFGILIRNMIAAVVIAIAFAYMIEPMVTMAMMFLSQAYPAVNAFEIIQNLMPSGASILVMGISSPLAGAPAHPFALWGSILVLLGWTAVPALLGSLVTVRRDVN